NGFRPAADPLFRTAAHIYGNRVAGVVLSGGLDDGTLGMKSIKYSGGIAMVQEPSEALHPGMPESVLRHVSVDYVVAVRQMPPLLVQLAQGKSPGGDTPMKRFGSAHTNGHDPAKQGEA